MSMYAAVTLLILAKLTTTYCQTPKDKFECCINNQLGLYLQEDVPRVTGSVPFVNIMERANGNNRTVCDTKLLLNATFQRISQDDQCQNCTNQPKCGYKMLRIDLLMDLIKTGFSFHVGDSRTNNGHKRDDNTQSNDAEFHSLGYEHKLFGSDECADMSLNMDSLLSSTVTMVTIFVGNEFIRVSNDQGYAYELCSKCLFALNGQPDSQGSVNEVIFIGLNRVINGQPDRVGTGVCSAVISWACPWAVRVDRMT